MFVNPSFVFKFRDLEKVDVESSVESNIRLNGNNSISTILGSTPELCSGCGDSVGSSYFSYAVPIPCAV